MKVADYFYKYFAANSEEKARSPKLVHSWRVM